MVVAFPILFAGTLCFVCFTLSRLGGWHRLGEKYRAAGLPEGKAFYGQSAQLGGFCNYNRCLTVVIADEGLYLQVWLFVRFAHPALLIPWDEIRNPEPGSLLWMKKVAFQVGAPPVAKISVSERLFGQFPK